MGLLSHLFFFYLFVLACIANIQLPIKQYQDGSKSSFIQAPYISIARAETVKGIQEEITNSWPEGIITYYLDDNSYDISIGDRIRKAMSVLEAASCIRFRNETIKPKGNVSWIHITNPDKKRQCVHDPKTVKKGEIMLTLGYDCLGHEDLIHSLLHGIGFKDEITHPHRDKYIRVLWDNIQPAHRHLYRVQPVHTSRSIVEYDPLSIMHFHDRAFSSNGKATIVPLEPGLVISPSESLSQLDKMRLHLYFGHECNKRKFSSLMETCKKTLKDEQPAEDDHDQEGGYDKVTDDTKENKENEEGKETTDENNVSGDENTKVSVTAEEKENQKLSVTAEEKENQKLSVTAEEKENQKLSVTAEEKENQKLSVTAEEKENQKLSVTAEEEENQKLSVTAEEKENQKLSVTAEEEENQKLSVTAEEEENQKLSVTAEEKEKQKLSVTAEEKENQKLSVTAEEKENQKLSVTAEEKENQKLSVTAEEKENQKLSVTAEEKENQKLSVTAEEKENHKLSVTAEEKENQKLSVTAEEKENQKLSVTAEEKENHKLSVTAEEKENQKLSVTAEEKENQKLSVTAEEEENQKLSVTAEEKENQKLSVTAEEKENQKLSVTAEEKEKSKQSDESPNTTLTPVTVLQGLLLVQKKVPDFLPNKGASGINFNYDSAEK